MPENTPPDHTRSAGGPLLSDARIDTLYRVLSSTMPGRTADARGPKGQADAFRSCIACMLSAQSRDANTALATRQLFRLARKPATLLALSDERIAAAIKPAGLYNMKTRNIRRFCEVLLADFDGVVPREREALMSLPGIGRKCADIVLSFTFGVDVIAVDTHVHRVCNRTGLARGRTEAQTARSLEQRSPAWALRDGHFWLLQFGKQVCTARKPDCHRCPVANVCLWEGKLRVADPAADVPAAGVGVADDGT